MEEPGIRPACRGRRRAYPEAPPTPVAGGHAQNTAARSPASAPAPPLGGGARLGLQQQTIAPGLHLTRFGDATPNARHKEIGWPFHAARTLASPTNAIAISR